jgi:hypothetical protein
MGPKWLDWELGSIGIPVTLDLGYKNGAFDTDDVRRLCNFALFMNRFRPLISRRLFASGSSSSSKNYYAILELESKPSCSSKEIKAKFYELSKRY